MKNVVLSFAAFLAIVGASFAIYGMGFGATVGVTGPATKTAIVSPVGTLSVYNSSGNIVYCLVNCETTDLTAAIDAGTAVPVPALKSYTFDAQGKGHIVSICLQNATTNWTATNTVYIAGF